MSKLSEQQAQNPETPAWEQFQQKTDPDKGGDNKYIINAYEKSDVRRDYRKEKRMERKNQRKVEYDTLRSHLTVTGRVGLNNCTK